MHIDFLADHPEFIDPIVRWHHEEWGFLRPGDTVEARTARLIAECGRGEIPTTFVAFTGSTVIGSATLLAHDMDTRMDLTPWLGGVYVASDYRRRGIGSELVGRVVEVAARLGVPRLYLYTPSAEQMYSRLGWLPIERTHYHGADVVVMSYDVRPDTALDHWATMHPSVRQAMREDTEIVADILGEAARWLEKSGMGMWRDDELVPASIAADVAGGLFFLAECDGEAAGVVKFQLEDGRFWPDVPQGEAAFVHRLAVRRRFAGGEVSSALLGWAVERARSLGRDFLRLDCEASRAKLRAIYERFGFVHHSDRQVGPYYVSRYEYRVR